MAIRYQVVHRTIYAYVILTTTLTAKYHLHLPNEQNEDKKD